MPIKTYNSIKKIRVAMIEEISKEYPTLALMDKLTLVEMRIQSNLMAGLEEKDIVDESKKPNAPIK